MFACHFSLSPPPFFSFPLFRVVLRCARVGGARGRPERARSVSGAVAEALVRFSGDGWLREGPPETCCSLVSPSCGKELTS